MTQERILIGDINLIASSSWSIDTSASRVNFMIDLTGTDLLLGDEIELHWGFTCANDVAEGPYPTPVPGTIALLSIDLFGFISASTLSEIIISENSLVGLN